VLYPLHDPGKVRINNAVAYLKFLLQLVETEKKGMFKIPGNGATAPAVVVCTGVEPMQKERSNPQVPPFNVDIEVVQRCVQEFVFHSSVSSGLRKQFSTLLTNLWDW